MGNFESNITGIEKGLFSLIGDGIPESIIIQRLKTWKYLTTQHPETETPDSEQNKLSGNAFFEPSTSVIEDAIEETVMKSIKRNCKKKSSNNAKRKKVCKSTSEIDIEQAVEDLDGLNGANIDGHLQYF